MLKKIGLLLALVGLVAYINPALATKPVDEQAIPEVDGIYDVAGHPEMKVHVFVHKAPGKPVNSGKPGPGTSTRVCGLASADQDSAAVTGATGWHIPTGTWTYSVNQAVPATVTGNVNTIANNAFNAWRGVAQLNSKITIEQGANTSVNRAKLDGQNIIAWGTTSGSALAVTYTWYNQSTGVVTENDTIMNNKFSWNWGNAGNDCAWTNVYDAQDIMTHELGHWFGLKDHYTADYVNNTMYGYGATGEVKSNTLTIGDKLGIEAIY